MKRTVRHQASGSMPYYPVSHFHAQISYHRHDLELWIALVVISQQKYSKVEHLGRDFLQLKSCVPARPQGLNVQRHAHYHPSYPVFPNSASETRCAYETPGVRREVHL